jgi:hypothetical protein
MDKVAWSRELLSLVRKHLPRWRWTSTLRQRGGVLEGKSQKDAVRFIIAYARRSWDVQIWLFQKRWIWLDIQRVNSVKELFLFIQYTCNQHP